MIKTSHNKPYKVVNNRCAINIWDRINIRDSLNYSERKSNSDTVYRCVIGDIKTDFR